MLHLWQEGARKVDAILAMVDSWKFWMSTESFQDAMKGLMQACGRVPEGVASVQSPKEQTFNTNQVISDCNHHYICSHSRGAQVDSGQVESLEPVKLEPKPMSQQRFAFQ